jgi:pSer/pThr/pTyr-binding forkhead associated (FHA) protein
MVRDLGSLNGTFVRNERIAGDAPLPPGELLTVGAVTFRAVYEEESESSAPPQGPAPQMKPRSAETVRTGSSAGKPKIQPPGPQVESDENEAQFEFDAPLLSDDDEQEPGDTAMPLPTPKTDATAEAIGLGPNESQSARPANKSPAKPAPAKPPAGDEQTIDVASKWTDDEDETSKEPDDEDDFGDFLKSLNK